MCAEVWSIQNSSKYLAGSYLFTFASSTKVSNIDQ